MSVLFLVIETRRRLHLQRENEAKQRAERKRRGVSMSASKVATQPKKRG